MKTFRKQPNDHLDYTIDLSAWLEAGDSVATATVEAPAGVEVTGVEINSPKVTVWIKGGENGKTYKFSPLIQTQSRTKEVDFLLVIVDL